MGSFDIKKLGYVSIGLVVSSLIGFLSTPIITRLIEPEIYGMQSLFVTYCNIVLGIVLLGLDQSLVRFFYKDTCLKYKRDLLQCTIKLPLLLSIMIITCLFCFHSHIYYFKELSLEVVICFCITLIVLVFNKFALLLVRLQNQGKLYSSILILQRVIYLVSFLGMYLISYKNGFIILILATLYSQVIVTVIAIIANKDIWKFNKINIDKNNRVKMFKYGVPFVFSSLASILLGEMGKLSLAQYSTVKEVGYYAATGTIVNILILLQTAFSTVWVPAAMEAYETQKNNTQFFYMSNQIVTVFLYIIYIGIVLLKGVIVILFGNSYFETQYILPLLMFWPIMFTISETTVYGINFKGKTQWHIVIVGLSCLMNFLGCRILTPCFGAKGAAISVAIAYICFFSLRTVLGIKYYYINFKLGKFYTITGAIFLYGLYNTFFEMNLLNGLIGIGLIGIIIFAYMDIIQTCGAVGLKYIKSQQK